MNHTQAPGLEAVRATGEWLSWVLLAVHWPVLDVVSLFRPAPLPAWRTPFAEPAPRRRWL